VTRYGEYLSSDEDDIVPRVIKRIPQSEPVQLSTRPGLRPTRGARKRTPPPSMAMQADEDEDGPPRPAKRSFFRGPAAIVNDYYQYE
jgi:hypothetical protein